MWHETQPRASGGKYKLLCGTRHSLAPAGGVHLIPKHLLMPHKTTFFFNRNYLDYGAQDEALRQRVFILFIMIVVQLTLGYLLPNLGIGY